MLIYMTIFLFPRKLFVWFKRCCSPERKDVFSIILCICHFTQTAVLLPLPHFGFRNLTMQSSVRHQKFPGKRSAFSFCCRSVVPNLNSNDDNIDQDRLHHCYRDAKK